MPNEVHTTSVCRCRSGWWACPTRSSGQIHLVRGAMYPPFGVRWYTLLGVQWYTWLGVQCTLRSWLGGTPRSDQRYCLVRGRGNVPLGAGVMPHSVQRYCLVRGRGNAPLGAEILPRSGQRYCPARCRGNASLGAEVMSRSDRV